MSASASIEYFRQKAETYDDTDLQPYWNFSDELLWNLLYSTVLPKDVNSRFSLLDVGGGTGRWTDRILSCYTQATAELLDISQDMLSVAKRKFRQDRFSGRVNVHLEDAEEMTSIANESKDIAICFHNVIGFVDSPQRLLSRIFEKLVGMGRLALMIPSYYHALYFSNATRRYEELDRITKNSQVKYNGDMPAIHVFEIDETIKLLKTSGYINIRFYGFPISLYPGMEETRKYGSTDNLVSLLGNEDRRRMLLEIEKRLCLKTELAPRGNNILVTAFKADPHPPKEE